MAEASEREDDSRTQEESEQNVSATSSELRRRGLEDDNLTSDNKPPQPKKACLAVDKAKLELEVRLGGILCCAVCLDLPRVSVFQCSNGHLMCAGCFNHLLADARIKDETPTCPNCRVELSRSSCTRNLAVEKAVSELPVECTYCSCKFPRNMIENHEAKLCPDRTASCEYQLMGCEWQGRHRDALHHSAVCNVPHRPAIEAFPFILRQVEASRREKTEFSKYVNLLSLEKMMFIDVQLRPYRTEEFSNRLYYETTRFSAFGSLFNVNLRLNDNQPDAHLLSERYLSYQLVLRGKPSSRFTVHFTIVPGPFGAMKVLPHTAHHEYTDTSTESEWTRLPLEDAAECNKLLANRSIDLRIVMSRS